MVEVEKYTDPFNTPVNIDNCGGVMDSVSAPYTQEYACLFVLLGLELTVKVEWFQDLYECLRRSTSRRLASMRDELATRPA